MIDSKLLEDDDLLGDMIEDSPLLQLENSKTKNVADALLGVPEREDFGDDDILDDKLQVMSPVKDESSLLPAARAFRGPDK